MAEKANSSSIRRYLIATLLLAGYIFLCLTQGRLNYDEGYYLTAIRNIQNGMIPYKDFAYAQGALLPYFNAVILKPFALNVLNARLLNIFYLLVSVAFIWRFLKPNKIPIIFSLLLFTLISFEPLYFLIIFKTYGLASLFLVSAVILYIRSIKHKNGNHLLMAIYFSLFATLIRYSLFPFPLFFGIILLIKTFKDRSPENWIRLLFAALPIPLLLVYVNYVGFENFWFHSVEFHTNINPKFTFFKRIGILLGIYIANYWMVFITLLMVGIWSVINRKWVSGTFLYIPFILVGLMHMLTGTMQAEYQTVIYLSLAAYLLHLVSVDTALQNLFNKYLATIAFVWLVLQPVNYLWSGYGFLEGRSDIIQTEGVINKKLEELKTKNPQLKTIFSQDLSFALNSEFEPFPQDYMGMFTFWEDCKIDQHLFCPDYMQALLDSEEVDVIIFNERFLAKIYPSGAKFDNTQFLRSIEENYAIVDTVPVAGQYLEEFWVGVRK